MVTLFMDRQGDKHVLCGAQVNYKRESHPSFISRAIPV